MNDEEHGANNPSSDTPITNDLQSIPAITSSNGARPERGYHTFRNGMINVKPKTADEKAKADHNSNTDLLRLPAELRNCIWEYVLGGNEFRDTDVTGNSMKYRFKLPPGTGSDTFALLETCRQIYNETAVLPITENTFVLWWFRIRGQEKDLTKFQRMAIKVLHVEVSQYDLRDFMLEYTVGWFNKMSLKSRFPNLKTVCLRLVPNGQFLPTLMECIEIALAELVPNLEEEKFEVEMEWRADLWLQFFTADEVML